MPWVVVAVIILGLAVIAGAWVLAGPVGSPDGRGPPDPDRFQRDSVDHDHEVVARAAPDATALAVHVRAENQTRVDIHYTNVGWWSDARVSVQHNIAANDLTARRIVHAARATVEITTCHSGTPDETWDIRSCPRRDFKRVGSFRTDGGLGPEGEIWYVAAYGASRAELAIEIHSEEPVQIAQKWSMDTRAVILYENRTEEGEPESGSKFEGHARLSLQGPSFGSMTVVGESDARPGYEFRGEGRHYRFEPAEPTYYNRFGERTALPAFPAPGGSFAATAKGGDRGDREGAERASGLVLGLMEAEGFLTPDAWLPPVGSDS